MTKSHQYCLPAILLAALVASGCGGPEYPKTVEVTGTVTLDGKPVPNAIVTFKPSDGQRSGTGYTDENGQFTLTTYQEGDGAVPGKHNVAIYPKDPPPMPGEVAVMGEEKPKSPKSYTPPFPAKYGAPAKSGLTAEVKPDAENDFTFEMKSTG